MNRMKFNAYMKEFPFLKESNTKWNNDQRDPLNCDSIKVARISKELLTYTPRYNGATGSLVAIDDGERFDFILSNGDTIMNAVKSSGYITHTEAHRENESSPGETVLEAIDRHEVALGLEFIVKVSYGYNIRDHYSLPDYDLIIYKAAKDFALIDILAAAKKKALADVRAEAAF